MHVKKTALLLLFSVFFAGMIYAEEETPQAADKNMNIDPGLYVGLAAGFTYNYIYTSEAGRDYTEYQDGQGFVVCIPFRYVIFPWLALQAEVQYMQRNYSWNRTGPYSEIYTNVNNNFVDVPFMANVSFGNEKTRVFINAGGYAGFWINSNIQGTMKEITTDPFDPEKEFYTDFNETVEFREAKDAQIQAGLLAGIGVQMFTNRFTIFIEGRYYYGLTDMQNENDYGLAIPRFNSTLEVRIGMFISTDSIKELIKGGK